MQHLLHGAQPVVVSLRPLRALFVLISVLALTASAVAPARGAADDTEDLIRRALEMRRTGDDQGAQPLFRRANEQSHSPRSAAQLGFCEQALGRWADAETHLGEALHAPQDPWVSKNRAAIEQALMLIKSRIARLEITGEPTGAEVAINGNVVGRLPLDAPVRVAGGEIEIELRAPGYRSTIKRLHIEGGQYQRTTLRAEKESPGAATTSTVGARPSEHVAINATTAADTNATELRAVHPDAASSDATESAGTLRRSLKFIAWGLALGPAALGVYGITDNRAKVATFDSGCGTTASGGAAAKPGAPSGYTDDQCRQLRTRYEWSAKAGIIGIVGAVVLTGGGFALWLTEPEPPTQQTAWGQCLRTLSFTGAAGSCTVRF